MSLRALSYCDFVQPDSLDRRPVNREATGLGGEHINLISALPDEAPEAFDGSGGLNMSVHSLRKLVKRKAGVLRLQLSFVSLPR
jgi:hypothetical protein